MTYNLTQCAQELWPENEFMQQAWINAINVLRTKTKRGWLLDTEIMKKES